MISTLSDISRAVPPGLSADASSQAVDWEELVLKIVSTLIVYTAYILYLRYGPRYRTARKFSDLKRILDGHLNRLYQTQREWVAPGYAVLLERMKQHSEEIAHKSIEEFTSWVTQQAVDVNTDSEIFRDFALGAAELEIIQ